MRTPCKLLTALLAMQVVVILPADCLAQITADTQATFDATEKPFPVLAWYSVPEAHTTVELYRELAEAGFTHSFSPASSADAVVKQLDVGKATGVKVFVSCADLLGAKAEETILRIKDHPALAGYYVRDEPPAGEFANVAMQVKRIQAADDRRPCYVNLFPNYANPGQLGTGTYQEYVDRFIREVPLPILSFDHYPVVAGKQRRASLRPEWYENLEIVAAAARKADKPMWAFALCCPHAVYPAPTTAHLRLQVFSNLAYGAQTIQYFTYWTPPPADFDFHDAPISADGKRTVAYERVQQMNSEVQALRGVFLGAKVLTLGHTGEELAGGTKRYEPAGPIKKVKTNGQGAVVSHLSNAGRQFLVIVNRDVNEPMPLALELDVENPLHRIEKDGKLHPVRDATFEAHLEPGDVCVLTWQEKPKK